MTQDYEILPLTHEYVDECKVHGLVVQPSSGLRILKCFARDGDLYRQYTCLVNNEDVNTKDFVLLVHEGLNICSQAIKVAKAKV